MPHRAIGAWFRATRRTLLRTWPLLALLGLTAFCLSPALGTGYWAEDIYYSAMIPANPILKRTTWFADTLESVKHSMLVGRFYPITPLITGIVFILFRNVVAYKAYIIAVTLIDVALFHALVRRLTGRKGFAALAAATTVALFQFRLTVDPILAYYGQIEWVIAAFFVSLISLRRYLEAGRYRWLALSVLSYLFCTLAYEMTYTLVAIPVFLIAQARPGWRAGALLARPYLAAAGGCAGMTVLIRWLHPSANYVHQTDFHLASALGSLASQVSAGLPLSYYCGDPLSLFSRQRRPEQWIDWLLQPGVIGVFIAAMALSFRNLRKARRSSSRNLGPMDDPTLIGLGLLLAVCPAILTAISPYHRMYLSFGVGWIGVMVQYYGVGLLLALGLWHLVAGTAGGGPFARGKCMAASLVLAAVLAITFRANIEVATALNAPPGSPRFRTFVANHGASWHLHRMNLVAALDAGVLDEVPPDSRVQLANLYPYWHDSLYGQFFYTKQTGKRIETFPAELPSRLAPDAPLFRVRDALRDRKTGLVVVTPAAYAPTSPGAAPIRGHGRVFIRHPSLRPDRGGIPPLLLVGQSLPGAGSKDSVVHQVFRVGEELPLLQLGPGWGLCRFDLTSNPVNPDSLRLVDDPIQVAAWLQTPGDPARTAARAFGGSSTRQ